LGARGFQVSFLLQDVCEKQSVREWLHCPRQDLPHAAGLRLRRSPGREIRPERPFTPQTLMG